MYAYIEQERDPGQGVYGHVSATRRNFHEAPGNNGPDQKQDGEQRPDPTPKLDPPALDIGCAER
jgi:hypothetical protein